MVAMVITITNFWKLLCYGVKRDHCDNFIGIREFLEQLALDCFNSFLQLTPGLHKNIPLLDEVNNGDTVPNLHVIHFYSSASSST